MKLTQANYYSPKANREYFSVSQFKDFMKCPAMAMAKLRGEYKDEESRALLLGSYVDEMLTGTFKSQVKFIAENYSELFQKSSKLIGVLSKFDTLGERKEFLSGCDDVLYFFCEGNKPFADIVQANEAIRRVKEQPLMMKYLGGGHQKIMVGEIDGVPIKGKFDSYSPDEYIADLKYLKDFRSPNMFENAISYYSYDMQLAVYQELVRQSASANLPCYLVIVTKQNPPDVAVVEINQYDLDNALDTFKKRIKHFQAIKNGETEATRCESTECPYCRATRVLKEPLDSSLLGMSRKQLDAMEGVI